MPSTPSAKLTPQAGIHSHEPPSWNGSPEVTSKASPAATPRASTSSETTSAALFARPGFPVGSTATSSPPRIGSAMSASR